MNIEYVKISSENSFVVPGKWVCINSTLNGTNSGFFWLKRVSYSIENQNDLDDYKESCTGYKRPDISKLKGTIGEYIVTSFNQIGHYMRDYRLTEDLYSNFYIVG